MKVKITFNYVAKMARNECNNWVIFRVFNYSKIGLSFLTRKTESSSDCKSEISRITLVQMQQHE